MTGRHATLRGPSTSLWPRRLGLAVAAMSTLAAAGLGVASVVAPSDEGCAGMLSARVSADPAIAPVLSEIAATYNDEGPSSGGRCVEVDVTEATSEQVDSVLGTPEAPDLWIPKSELFAGAVDAGSVERLASVALSPLVVSMPKAAAEELGLPESQVSWLSLLQDGNGVLPDPSGTDEGVAALAAVRTALGDDAEQTELVQMMTTAAESVVPSADEGFTTVAQQGSAGAFVTLERDVVVHNRDAPETPFVAVYPTEGTLAFDFPALVVRHDDSDEARTAAVTDFVTHLGSEASLEAVRAAGFRSPDGTAAEVTGIVEGIRPAMPDLLPAPDPAAITAIERQWAALALDMRMLAVIDISGSMNEQADGGDTRIELTRDAALEALNLFPRSSSVGLWAFSILRDPPRDHVELVDVGPMDEQIEGGTRLDALVSGLNSLPGLVEGGTGLYDTTLAAFQEMRGSYQPGMINSVVLLTDGRNEDDPDGTDLATLLTTLTAQFDPSAPVPIITIGMGPDADMDALRQIAEATGTQAYQARDPREIREVFLQAMIERQCRPNC